MTLRDGNKIDVEAAVLERYSSGARCCENSLCCAVDYDRRLLDVIPAEIVERDYGCGDPSRYLHPGETVLDLGSGSGKICYIAAQIVGPAGRVVGVDMNDNMLALARKYQSEIARRLGYDNVEFRKGRIQDLALDIEKLEAALDSEPVVSPAFAIETEIVAARLRRSQPMIESNSMDVVISNCVLNLVDPTAKKNLFDEIFRVLKTGGRAVISDIVSDADIPAEMQNDPNLWSGCISGAFREHLFLDAFRAAGFALVQLVSRDEKPWQTIRNIEFRSVTVEARKG